MKQVIHKAFLLIGTMLAVPAFAGSSAFTVAAAEYVYNSNGITVNFTGTTESTPVSANWTVLNVTNPASPAAICSGSEPFVGVRLFGKTIALPQTYIRSCAVPFIFGETKLQIRVCAGTSISCPKSAVKSVFQFDAPEDAPSIGSWSHFYFIELFSEYKLNETIAFDMTYPAVYMRPVTLHIKDGTTNNDICTQTITPTSFLSHTAPGIGSCSASYSALGNKTVYAQMCYDGNLACGPKSATTAFTIVNDPALVLNTNNWALRKNAGPRNLNVPYVDTQSKTIAAYYTEWSVYARKYYPKDIPVENLTHIYHASIAVCGNNAALLAAQNDNIRDGSPNRPYNVLQASCVGKKTDQVTIFDRDAAINSVGWISGGKLDPSELPSDPVHGIFAEYYRMKKVFPQIKILPSIGGGTLSDPLFDLAKDPARRTVFVKSAIDFIHKYDFFDGIDIDWEFPVKGGATTGIASPEDAQAYVDLTRELRMHLDHLGAVNHRYYELHATFGGTPGFIESLLLADMNNIPYYQNNRTSIDHFNFMTYDYYGAWNNNFGHHAAISNVGGGTPNDGLSAEEVMWKATSMGVPTDKISIGIAAYARGWDGILSPSDDPFDGSATGGIPSKGYKDWIASELIQAQATGRWGPGVADYKGMEANEMGGPNGTGVNGWKLKSDSVVAAHQYLWNPATGVDSFGRTTGSLMSLDTAKSAETKGALIMQNHLGGAIIWSIDGDSGTLLNSLHKGYGNPRK